MTDTGSDSIKMFWIANDKGLTNSKMCDMIDNVKGVFVLDILSGDRIKFKLRAYEEEDYANIGDWGYNQLKFMSDKFPNKKCGLGFEVTGINNNDDLVYIKNTDIGVFFDEIVEIRRKGKKIF